MAFFIVYAQGHHIGVGCACMVGKLTLFLVSDWVGSVNGTTSNRVARLHETENICRVSTRRDRSHLRVKNPPIMVKHSPQQLKAIKVFGFAEPTVGHQKSATHRKAQGF